MAILYGLPEAREPLVVRLLLIQAGERRRRAAECRDPVAGTALTPPTLTVTPTTKVGKAAVGEIRGVEIFNTLANKYSEMRYLARLQVKL